jgi:hypothetical protein
LSSTNQANGLSPVYHPSGIIRQEQQTDGIASGYATSLFTNTPVKRTTDGTLIATAVGADSCIGVFQGCQYTSNSKRFISAYWPASTTYDAGSMLTFYTSDTQIIYEGQASGPVAATAVGEGINLLDASAGSTYTGISSQRLNATTTGATAATFQVVGLAPYSDNAWGDLFTKVRVKIATYQGQIA